MQFFYFGPSVSCHCIIHCKMGSKSAALNRQISEAKAKYERNLTIRQDREIRLLEGAKVRAWKKKKSPSSNKTNTRRNVQDQQWESQGKLSWQFQDNSARLILLFHSFYDAIGPGERLPLSQIAVQHLKRKVRPLRTAIDVSIWWLQTQSSKRSENTALRTLCHRLARLFALSVFLLWVLWIQDVSSSNLGPESRLM